MAQYAVSHAHKQLSSVTVVAITSLIFGTLGALYEVYVLGNLVISSFSSHFEFASDASNLLLILPLAVYLAEIVSGLGFLRHESWAWKFGIVAQLFACISGVWLLAIWLRYSAGFDEGVIRPAFTLLIPLLILIYLLTPAARQALRDAGQGPGAGAFSNKTGAAPHITRLPIGLAIASFACIITGMLEATSGIRLLESAGVWLLAIDFLAAVLLLFVAGLAQIVFGVGALMGKRWARVFGIFTQVAQIVITAGVIWLFTRSFLGSFLGLGWLMPLATLILALVPAAILVYLFIPAGKRALSLPSQEPGAGTLLSQE